MQKCSLLPLCSTTNKNQQVVIWRIMNKKGSCIFSLASTQTGVIKMAPTPLNNVTNIAKKLSCQDVKNQ